MGLIISVFCRRSERYVTHHDVAQDHASAVMRVSGFDVMDGFSCPLDLRQVRRIAGITGLTLAPDVYAYQLEWYE